MTGTGSGGSGWTPPTVEELHQLLPQYEIDAIIGHGGMGAVYKGRQETLGRTVAIKLLPESLIADGDDFNYVERFKLEARSMANLDHPAIISVFDFGQTDAGHLYFVMEFIDGMDIQQYIAACGGSVDPEHAIAIVSHVLDALDYAHSKGIIHRDIKPANVLINSEGRVKIADFGLAKEFSVDGDNAAAIGLTMTDMAMGTPDYIAPEALETGVTADGRADLYAVGVMLYVMLTGRLPRGMFKLPSEEKPGLDPRFDDVVARALENRPENRFQHATEFRGKLDALLSQPVTRIDAHQDTASVSPPARQLNFGASAIRAQDRKKPATAGTAASPAKKKTVPKAKAAKPAKTKSPGLLVGIPAALLLIGGIIFFATRGGKDSGHQAQSPATEAPASEGADVVESTVPAKATDSVPPAQATTDRPFVNGLGMKFVPVPITGGPSDGQQVLFSVWETRVGDFEAFVSSSSGISNRTPPFEQSKVHPVVQVSWSDAMAFCDWLTKEDRKSGRIGTNERYRLPSDHEWSCAVGIGKMEDAEASPGSKSGKIDDHFPWGTEWPPAQPVGNYYGEENRSNSAERDIAMKFFTGYDDPFDRTAPVGSFAAGKYGLYDLGGNVGELCLDPLNEEGRHVIRGVGYSEGSRNQLLSSHRLSVRNEQRTKTVGFRCVLAADNGAAASTSD